MNTAVSTAGIFGSLGLIIYLILIGVSVYALVLFIQLARRGIQALDLYIEEKRRNSRLP